MSTNTSDPCKEYTASCLSGRYDNSCGELELNHRSAEGDDQPLAYCIRRHSLDQFEKDVSRAGRGRIRSAPVTTKF